MSLDDMDELFRELDEIEDKKPERVERRPVVVEEKPREPRTIRIKTFKIPDFNAFLKFCEKNLDDYEVEQFYKHTLPDSIHQLKFGYKRGGGGWSGVVKATINIMRKMKEKGVL